MDAATSVGGVGEWLPPAKTGEECSGDVAGGWESAQKGRGRASGNGARGGGWGFQSSDIDERYRHNRSATCGSSVVTELKKETSNNILEDTSCPANLHLTGDVKGSPLEARLFCQGYYIQHVGWSTLVLADMHRGSTLLAIT